MHVAGRVGLEPEDICPQQAGDALGELANIIAGQLATDLLGEHAIVQLSPPMLESFDADCWTAWQRRANSLLLLVQDEPMWLNLQVES